MFGTARDYRDALPDSSGGPLKKRYEIYCDIYDEAGGIATIATLLAMNNISVKTSASRITVNLGKVYCASNFMIRMPATTLSALSWNAIILCTKDRSLVWR